MDYLPVLDRISAPVLVVASDHDVSLPWSGHGEILAARIRGAQFVHLPTAHLSNVERPSSFNSALLGFLPTGSGDDPFTAGMTMRRAILGDAYVDRSLLNTTPLTRDFQDLIARYAWGMVWIRPGLDPRTRRLLVLAITAALGCWEEFRLHVSTGLEHELEPADLKEVLLQTAIYAGVPAANTGFRIASEEWGGL
jgi:3-oxoadipate enol-lactonase/4-carboxymuconolactone decarboxylase